jgi:hypothetical protein
VKDKQYWAKLVKKIGDDPLGREMLGEALGLEITHSDDLQHKAEVVVLVPSYRAAHPKMLDALGHAVAYAKQFCGVSAPPRCQSCVIHWSRNDLVTSAYRTNKFFTHVLFVDDDIVPDRDSIVKMLRHDKDFVGAMCVARVDPPQPVIRRFNPENGFYEPIVRWNELEPLIEVDAVGTGMVLVKRAVFDAVAQYWIECRREQELYGLAGERLETISAARKDFYAKNQNAWWFQFMERADCVAEYGEDVSFCHKVRACGFKIHVDVTVAPGHVGDYAYSLSDFKPYQQELIERYERQTTNEEVGSHQARAE